MTSALRKREDHDLPARLAISAATAAGVHLTTEQFDSWLAERGRAHTFEVSRVPFAELDGWHFAEDTGNLVHRSGRFFAVEGLWVRTSTGLFPEWHQPIINQPEVGILGIVVKEFGGVLH
ncbi:MAG: NDP-hexose 2,3-dehydratase family protein, partial [Pseudonocardiaceae bacterium]